MPAADFEPGYAPVVVIRRLAEGSSVIGFSSTESQGLPRLHRRLEEGGWCDRSRLVPTATAR